MRILFDFRVYDIDPYRGMGRYIYCLVTHILKNYPEIEISIIKNNEKEHPVFNYNNDKVKYYYLDKLDSYNFKDKFDFYFLDDILSESNKIKNLTDFFNGLYPAKILENSKRIICIGHDLIPLIFHKYYLCDNDYYIIHLETTKIIEHFFVNSEHTKEDFIKYLNIDKDKLTNIYGGVDEKYIAKKNYSYKDKLNNIVFVAGADKRKNAQGLIKGFAIAYKSDKIPKDSKLYICCKIHKDYSDFLENVIKKCNIENRVVITGFMSDESLIKLISTSKASFFPSFYEGLGLPILESYALSTPSFASNVSSTKELVLEECSFDPYDENDIANSIVKAFNDKELCKKSVEFGKKLLEEKCNWDIASKKVVEKLKELNKEIIINTSVLGTLPPEKTGIANYNSKAFGVNNNFHVFSDIKNMDNYKYANNYLGKNFKDNFIHIDYYNKFQDKYRYLKKIFVFGNSYHNVSYLKYAIEEKDKENSYLYMHEANNLSLIFYYLNTSIKNYKKILMNYYPNIDNYIKKSEYIYQIEEIAPKEKVFGVKIILQLTNIKNIIVNNDKCKELIINEVKGTEYDNKINIIKMFHPIEKIENVKNYIFNKKKKHNNIYIGHFGQLDSVKDTDTIIKSIYIINKKYNKKIKLVVSGYNAKDYINNIKDKTLTENIICFEAKKTEDFLSILNSVDIAIQLRNYPHGESSGVICQLLSLNKKIITTKNFLSKELSHSIREVKPFISAEELALEILDYLEDKTIIDNSELIEKYSFENLANKLLEL